MSEALAALRDGVIHQPIHNQVVESAAIEPLVVRLAEQDALLRQILARLDANEQAREELRDRQRRIDELSETVLNLHDRLTGQSRRLEEVYRSRSWRISRPLRGLARAARRLLDSGPR